MLKRGNRLNVLKIRRGSKKTKNNRLVLKCTCKSCGITKVRFVKASEAKGSVFLDMAIPMGAIAGVPFALGAAAMGSSKSGRDMMKDLGKAGLKVAEKPLRNMAGNMLEKAASIGAKKIRGGHLDIQKALVLLGELHLRTLPGLKKYNYRGSDPVLTSRDVEKEETRVLTTWMKSVNNTILIMIIQTHYY